MLRVWVNIVYVYNRLDYKCDTLLSALLIRHLDLPNLTCEFLQCQSEFLVLYTVCFYQVLVLTESRDLVVNGKVHVKMFGSRACNSASSDSVLCN